MFKSIFQKLAVFNVEPIVKQTINVNDTYVQVLQSNSNIIIMYTLIFPRLRELIIKLTELSVILSFSAAVSI